MPEHLMGAKLGTVQEDGWLYLILVGNGGWRHVVGHSVVTGPGTVAGYGAWWQLCTCQLGIALGTWECLAGMP